MTKNTYHDSDPLVREGMSHFDDNVAAHNAEQADPALVEQLGSDAAWQPGLPEDRYPGATDWHNYEYTPAQRSAASPDVIAEQSEGSDEDFAAYGGPENTMPSQAKTPRSLGRAAAKDRHPSSKDIDLTESEDAEDKDKTLVGV